MTKANPRVTPTEAQLALARKIDDRFHFELAKLSMGLSPLALSLAYADWLTHLGASPGRQMVLAQQAVALSLQALNDSFTSGGTIDAEGKHVPDKDLRFSDPLWEQWPFNGFKNGFKASEAWWRQATQLEGVSRHHQHMVNFFAGQALDALAPSNFALSNPQVLKSAAQSMGETLVKGCQNYLSDLVTQGAQSAASGEVEFKPLDFEVGRDVALTPGKVVFRNRLIELIQYAPSTDSVFLEPVLIVPSCIMKYYILDLSPANSMVRYLAAQGHTVFMISWRNPDESDRELGMQDYLQLGVMQAMAAVKTHTGAARIHALGYCLGGTFLAIVAAALGRHHRQAPAGPDAPRLRRRRDESLTLDELPELAGVTLLAAQTDFTEPGELGVFIDDEQLKTLRESMARSGYLSGQQMSGSFQFLNSRDLVWSRNTRRYLLGKDEIGNDMMSWNADVTRLPERMHNEYLSSLFLNNALANGHYRVAGVGVALMDIDAPLLVVGTVRDHVSPWRSVYKIHLLTDTQTTFILTAGGHNAGIVSEPGHAHRSYQMESVECGHAWVEPDIWAAEAPLHEGSWWEAMHAWLAARSGARVKPPVIATDSVLCDAPGEYVMVRYAD